MSQLGLGLNLSKTKGGVVPFNPLSLDPYLLFDTQSSMIGTFENPTLDLDPSKPDTLNVITATRAGVATYTDAAGVIQSASADTVRIDHVDGVPMILVEPSATNLVPYSEDFSHNSWYAFPNISLIDKDSIASPADTQTGNKIILGNGETRGQLRFSSTDRGGATNPIVEYTLEGDGIFSIVTPLPTGGEASIVAVENGWYRCSLYDSTADQTLSVYAKAGELNVIQLQFYQSQRNIYPKGNGDNTSGLYLWGAQLEGGSVATSYIPTSGSTVTRAADDLVISGSDFTNFYNQSEGTIYTETVARSSATSYLFMLIGVSSANYVFWNGAGQVKIKTAGVDQVNTSIGSIPLNSLARAAISYKENDFLGSVNGGAEVIDNSVLVPTVNNLQIGAYYTNTGHLNGHIKRLIYWPYHSDSL